MDLLWQFSVIHFLLSILPVYTATSICCTGILKQAWVIAFYSQRSWKPCSLQLPGMMEQAAQTNLCSSWLCCSNRSVKFSWCDFSANKNLSSTCINLFWMCFLSLLPSFGMYQRRKPSLSSNCSMKLDYATSSPLCWFRSHMLHASWDIFMYRKAGSNKYCLVRTLCFRLSGINEDDKNKWVMMLLKLLSWNNWQG